MGSRAQLLAGLRTGGPRTSSPSIESQGLDAGSPGVAQLKASAAPFMPGARSVSTATNPAIETQFAALRMQQAIAASADSQDLATKYGASNGQPFTSYEDEISAHFQVDNLEQLIMQKRAQAMQLQQQQKHLDGLRAQAAVYQQQQQQQQLAAQQYMLLAQMQADAMMQHEQRQAARSGLQNTLRQRQATQAFNQTMLQQGAPSPYTESDLRQQQLALMQQLQYLRQSQQAVSTASPSSDGATSWRSNSTSVLKGRTSGASDHATSWRSSSNTPTATRDEPSSPPSIVVDDSASDGPSECDSVHSKHDAQDTPETSAEDVGVALKTIGIKGGVRNSLNVAPVRPLALAAAPRSRVLSAEIKPAGSRQPRGPPTEFLAVNFASRLAAKTRREAMSKLCASPRVATFGATVTVS
jgi:hypothetical protein